jgi:hypothetical protein
MDIQLVSVASDLFPRWFSAVNHGNLLACQYYGDRRASLFGCLSQGRFQITDFSADLLCGLLSLLTIMSELTLGVKWNLWLAPMFNCHS